MRLLPASAPVRPVSGAALAAIVVIASTACGSAQGSPSAAASSRASASVASLTPAAAAAPTLFGSQAFCQKRVGGGTIYLLVTAGYGGSYECTLPDEGDATAAYGAPSRSAVVTRRPMMRGGAGGSRAAEPTARWLRLA